MPIPVAKLLEAQVPLRERVLKFLQQHPDQAFTLVELYAGIHGTSSPGLGAGTGASASDLGTMLGLILISPASRERILNPLEVTVAGLINEGKLQAADVQDAKYYALAR